ncbi:hypothetical protein CSB45_09185 [candidate division KSB3 bacterium]|uniref:Uncharacterized protein n=1 Tax=candidate division KSB3 bacterium TaxID=2044937 RepID=A0A2G6E4T1_9BACT|nr:MAG: hypothetical protein CSB45_09185 [candidate division KSB3 bacterium]PIE29614.1 MAG: hypothetical protein CSA57_07245 [candidate division KSB3 bacterium]
MQRLMRIAGCLSAVLLSLTACTSVPITHYYTFQPSLKVAPQATESVASSPFSLRVESFGGDIPYQQDKIIFRTSAYEVNFYEYHQWLRPPAELVTERVLDLAGASGLFQHVFEEESGELTRYMLDGRVLMFDQWYTKPTGSTIRVGIRYRLFAPELQDDPLWDDTIETTADTMNMEILGAIKAFETALYENITQALAAIDRVIAQHTE